MKKATQRIRYVRTTDGVRLAWAEAGAGPVMIKAANWLTHLEYEWESPVWRHWIRFFSDHFRYMRYDERGCGMTDRNVGDLSLERWVEDVEAVVAAADLREPFSLLGISQGGAICAAYAVKHPERVSKLVLYGGYARGPFRRGDPERASFYQAMIDLVRLEWGSDNPTFRQVFTSRFIPEGTEEQLGWYNDLCRKTMTPEIAAQLLESRAMIDVTRCSGRCGRRPWCCTRVAMSSFRLRKDTSSRPASQARSSSNSTRRTTSFSRANRRGDVFAMRCWSFWVCRARPTARTPRSQPFHRVSERC